MIVTLQTERVQTLDQVPAFGGAASIAAWPEPGLPRCATVREIPGEAAKNASIPSQHRIS